MTRLQKLVLWLMIFLFAGTGKTFSQKDQDKKMIISAMDLAADDWNRGDLTGYMDLYAPNATMMMSDGRVGIDSMRAIYTKYYFKGGVPVQRLSYDHYQLTFLGTNYALLTGRFVLAAAPNLSQRTGRFSLVFIYTKKSWKILHDHSG